MPGTGKIRAVYQGLSTERGLQLNYVCSRNQRYFMFIRDFRQNGDFNESLYYHAGKIFRFIRDFRRNGDFNMLGPAQAVTVSSLSGTFGGTGTSTHLCY